MKIADFENNMRQKAAVYIDLECGEGGLCMNFWASEKNIKDERKR